MWLNYHHLLYFWTVAKEGSVTRAAKLLKVSSPTVSAQIQKLGDTFGTPLFTRSGRGLVLTDVGQLVFRYADEIFGLGRELVDAVQGRPLGRPLRLVVGIADAVPKLIAHRLLEAALRLPGGVRVTCYDDKPERLLAELATHNLDVILTDTPPGPQSKVKSFSHLLGECGVTFFAKPALAKRLRANFPKSLQGVSACLPTTSSSLRRSIDAWSQRQKVTLDVVAELEDSALLETFGQSGVGVFAMPSVIEREVQKQYGVAVIGRLPEVRERYYAVSIERRLRHPAVIAITEQARSDLFA